MNNLKQQIDIAYSEKKIFFKPWIGPYYDEGVLFRGADHPVRLLVIGASRYCEYSWKQETQDPSQPICDYMEVCRHISDPNKLERIFDKCNYAKQYGDYQLSDINSASILSNTVDTYKSFKERLISMLDIDSDSKNEVWLHVSFMNYLQSIVWGEKKGNKRRLTPKRSNEPELYDDSEPFIKTVIDILQPDIIILWGPETFQKNLPLGRLFTQFLPIIHKESPSHYLLSYSNQTIPLVSN